MRDASGIPAPPIPHDADLRHMPGYMIDTQRLLDSEQAAMIDPAANWYALLCWCASMHQVPAGSLPDDDVMLAYLVRLGRDVRTWKKMRAAGALRGWIKHSDGRLYHPVVTENVIKLLEKSEAGRKAAREKRSQKTNQVIENIDSEGHDRDTTVERSFNKEKEIKGKVIEEDNTPPPITASAPDAPAPAAGGRAASQGRPWLIYIQAASDGFRDAGYERPNPAGDDATYAQQLLAEGFDPEIVRWTVETVTRDVMAKDPSRRPPNSLKYMIDAIRRNRAKPPPEMPQSQADTEDNARKLRELRLQGLIDKGLWQDHWGPRPTIDEAEAEVRGERKAA